MARVSSASTCSVTRMVPISAANEEPTRAPTTSAVRTGPSSMKTDLAMNVPTKTSGTAPWNW